MGLRVPENPGEKKVKCMCGATLQKPKTMCGYSMEHLGMLGTKATQRPACCTEAEGGIQAFQQDWECFSRGYWSLLGVYIAGAWPGEACPDSPSRGWSSRSLLGNVDISF